MKLRHIEINTTAFAEENFNLITDLSNEQIESVITPIVEAERDNEQMVYDNQTLFNALVMYYQDNIIQWVTTEKIVI